MPRLQQQEITKLERKAGRLIVGRLPGHELTPEARRSLESGGMGGVTLFKENAGSLEQLATLVHEIVQTSLHKPVIAVDQEGGAVQRFDHVITPLPSQMALNASDSADLVREVTMAGCEQLGLMGINCLLAPVLDVITNPHNPIVSTRASSTSPEHVARVGELLIESIRQAGLVPVGKHFPGHGATLEDSHHALAVSSASTERIWRIDLAPFKALMDQLPAILIGHIWVKAIDEEPVPASLSKRIIQGVLRDYLSYDGLVMTDDMTMKGLTDSLGIEGAAIASIEAGMDLLLVCATHDQSEAAREAIVKAVVDGRLTERRIDESVRRVGKCFSRKPKTAHPVKHPRRFQRLEKSIRSTGDISYEVSRRAISIIGEPRPPLTDSRWTFVVPEHPRYSLSVKSHVESLAKKRDDIGSEFGVTEIRYPLEPDFERAESIANGLRGENVVFLTFRALIHEDQMRLGQMIADQCAGKIACCTDMPLDFRGLPDWPTIITTCDPSDQAMMALAGILLGDPKPPDDRFIAQLMRGLGDPLLTVMSLEK